MRLAILLAATVLQTGSALADGWSCRNEAAEVTCADGTCTVAAGHTPMDLRVSETGSLSVCAYSGCWEGPAARLSRSEQYLMAEATDLRWSTEPGAAGIPGLVVIDRRARTGMVMVAGFVNPLTCTRTSD